MSTFALPPEVQEAVARRNAWVYMRARADEFGVVRDVEWFVYYNAEHKPPPGADLVSDPIWLHPEELAQLAPEEREFYLGGRVGHEPESAA